MPNVEHLRRDALALYTHGPPDYSAEDTAGNETKPYISYPQGYRATVECASFHGLIALPRTWKTYTHEYASCCNK